MGAARNRTEATSPGTGAQSVDLNVDLMTENERCAWTTCSCIHNFENARQEKADQRAKLSNYPRPTHVTLPLPVGTRDNLYMQWQCGTCSGNVALVQIPCSYLCMALAQHQTSPACSALMSGLRPPRRTGT